MCSMKITYIGHSGFLIEWDHSYWLFDYYTGIIPELKPNKKLFVFSSHSHSDHFNPDVLRLRDQLPSVQYILSSDIHWKKEYERAYGVGKEFFDEVLSIKPFCDYDLTDESTEMIHLRTLKSTDQGVAFLLKYQSKTIYHAGDLNLWMWKEESKMYNNDMKAKFLKEMEYLKDMPINVAFAPLDPRQEEWYSLGMDCLLSTAQVSYVFPMHFWDTPSVIQQYKNDSMNIGDTKVMDVSHKGQTWDLI